VGLNNLRRGNTGAEKEGRAKNAEKRRTNSPYLSLRRRREASSGISSYINKKGRVLHAIQGTPRIMSRSGK